MPRNRAGEGTQDMNVLEIGRKAIASFGPAVKSALLYTLLGIIIGMLLLWWQHYLEEINYSHVFWVRFLEHLGVGFIVSAIAVFFYEWGAHVKETVELSRDLNDIINYRIEPIVISTGKSALGRSLRALIGRDVEPLPENIQKIISECTKLVDDIATLQASHVWSSEQYVGFISYLIESVRANSTALRSVVVTEEGENRFIVAQTAAIMADKILTLQMQAMEAGDYYDVISSLPTWKGTQLNDFHTETENAVCRRGVNVRRIFNRLRYVSMEVNELSLDDAERILRTHLTNMTTWSTGTGKYEVRVLGRAELKKSTSSLLHEKAEKAHFGIFKHKHGEQNVRYSVEMADLSDMAIGKHSRVIQKELRTFDDAWKVSRLLTEELIQEIIEELREQKEKEALMKSNEAHTITSAKREGS